MDTFPILQRCELAKHSLPFAATEGSAPNPDHTKSKQKRKVARAPDKAVADKIFHDAKGLAQ